MDDATLLKSAMDRTTEDLPPLPDLAPVAIVQGRRRRARARLAAVGGVFGTVTAAALGLTLLPGPGTGVAMPAAPPVAFPSAYHTPVRLSPTPGQDAPEPETGAEAERRAQFQQQASALLDELLPATVTEIRPVEGQVSLYRITSAGRTFTATLSVRPADGEPLQPCRNIPSKRTKCENEDLGEGRTAQVYAMPVNELDTMGAMVRFAYGRSHVLFSVDPSEKAGGVAAASAPVTADQLLAVARDDRFTNLVKYADENPVQEKSTPVSGG
ncbi:hypothetical protein [Streptomyces sp. NBC_01353]|uniref:hypothetical protein n=1 Tax=Streptomyces sp. NBC_01353 TaxID=2903835 RepID=UPI002E2EABFB|nr:hypothetical protein [Streptomyces sp. NBC_01353]